MKNIFILATIVLFTSCKAQIYPLDTSPGDIPDNAYIKDTNNELDKYIGLWMGNWNNKTVYLEFKKVKYYYNDSNPYFIDKILGERKIINSNGQVEIDRISSFDLMHPEFRGVVQSLKYPGKDRLSFYPKNMCRKFATLDITTFTGTQMTLHFEYEPSRYDPNCIHNAYVDQYGDFPINFPINFPKDIILTKQ